MEMKKSVVQTGILCAVLLISACSTNSTLPAKYPSETECLGDLADGSYRMRAWGAGLNKLDAVQMAQKKAVQDVLFKGITRGQRGCLPMPVLPAPNARADHEAYFNDFFSDSGDYKKYIQVEKVLQAYKVAGAKEVVAAVQVRVQLADLRKDVQKKVKD